MPTAREEMEASRFTEMSGMATTGDRVLIRLAEIVPVGPPPKPTPADGPTPKTLDDIVADIDATTWATDYSGRTWAIEIEDYAAYFITSESIAWTCEREEAAVKCGARTIIEHGTDSPFLQDVLKTHTAMPAYFSELRHVSVNNMTVCVDLAVPVWTSITVTELTPANDPAES